MLINNWPGFYVPPLPPKQALGNLEKSFIEQRQYALNLFVIQVSRNKVLYESGEFQSFVKQQQWNGKNFIKDSINVITNKYMKVKMEFQKQQFTVNKQIDLNIISFKSYLKNIHQFKSYLFQIFKDIDKNLESDNFNSFSFGTYLLPEYEKMSIKEHLVDLDTQINNYPLFFQDKDQLIQEMRNIRILESFKVVKLKMKNQIYEIQAVYQCLDILEQYQSQLADVKKSYAELNQKLQKKKNKSKFSLSNMIQN